jgi:hypothetical protein
MRTFQNILFVIMMSPLCLSFYNRAYDIKHTIPEPTVEIPILSSHIWERQEHFNTAFKLARALLGAEDVFTWNGKEYTTLYKEEL